MARTTAAQFARQLRRLGATANANGRDVIATYHDVQVTARFASDLDGFDLAWRADAPADTAVIRSVAGVKRALGLPKQPIVIIAGTGRSNPAPTSCEPAGHTSRPAASLSTAARPKGPSAR